MAREPDVHHPHDPQADYQDRFAGLEARAPERLDHACGRLDQHAVGVAHRVGKPQGVALIGGADQEILGHPARIDFARAPGGALHVLAAAACRAAEARRVMMHEDAVARLEVAGCGAGLFDHADRLMSQHRAGLAADVPRHDIARTDPAGAGAHEDVADAGFRTGGFLDANIAEIVEACDLHDSQLKLCGAAASMSMGC